MITWSRAKLSGGAAALVAGVVLAVPVFACTEAPSINLNTLTAPAGSDVLLTGAVWMPGVPVVVHWDGLSGPVLATVTADSHGMLRPTTIRVPAGAEPGYHYLAATDNTFASSTARTAFQVTGTNGAGAPGPQAVLATPAATSNPSTVGVGVLALLAAMGGAGLLISGVGAVSLVRSLRRTPQVRVGARRRR